jgi:hypothetical protein
MSGSLGFDFALDPLQPRHGRQRGSARCQMQECTAGKFHLNLPLASHHSIHALNRKDDEIEAARPKFAGYLEIAQQIAENHYPLNDGGWNMVIQDKPEAHNSYTSALALHWCTGVVQGLCRGGTDRSLPVKQLNSSTLRRNERVKLAAMFWNIVGAGMFIGGVAGAFFFEGPRFWSRVGICSAGNCACIDFPTSGRPHIRLFARA